MKPGRAGRRHDRAQRHVTPRRGRRGERALHRLDALAHREVRRRHRPRSAPARQASPRTHGRPAHANANSSEHVALGRRRRADARAPRATASRCSGRPGPTTTCVTRSSASSQASASPAIEVRALRPTARAPRARRTRGPPTKLGVRLGALGHPRAGRVRTRRGGTCRSASRRRAGCTPCTRRRARAQSGSSSASSSALEQRVGVLDRTA